jgi:DNA topoisomerase-1
MKLVIVESPSKAKTISKYLGKDFRVLASVGHVRDLPKSNKKAIDIEGGFVPHYEIVAKKVDIIADIRAAAAKADEVLIATDPDREGEAIAWHLSELLTNKKLGGTVPKKEIKRITYHEVTKEAVEEALKHPRAIDEHLREAQEARRVLDRLVGYDLSGLIWKKVRYGLSAGRVQSPALRIIMEREREIRAFKPEDYWTITGNFKTTGKADLALTCTEEPRDKKEVDRILDIAKKEPWKIIDIEESEQKRQPRAPFITSTLQQTASSRLGFSPSRTMGIAQKLYESGFITYMRTDSTNLSKQALGTIAGTIEKNYGKEYLQFRTYAAKSKNAQEAHEAIRPSHFDKQSAGHNDEQKKLYRLIWQRTVSSQMADARMARTKIVANVEKEESKKQKAKSKDKEKKEVENRNKDAEDAELSNGRSLSERAEIVRAEGLTGFSTDRPVGEVRFREASFAGREKASVSGASETILSRSLESDTTIPYFTATGSRIIFDGWLKADPESTGEEVNLPKCAKNEKLDLISIDSEAKQTQPPGRYTEAGLIKELEKRGIGRPSTYASITRTIEARGYVEKEGRSLKPTDTGDVVSSFLEENFPTYISDTFTAEMENELDEIATGERTYIKTLSDFYGPFNKEVKSKDKLAKATNLGLADEKYKCPKCGSSMQIKLGRGGKFLSCSKYPDCDGALSIDGMEYKKDEPIGNDPTTGLPIFVLNGRFGPYVQLGVKLPKEKKARKPKKTTKKEKSAVAEKKVAVGVANAIDDSQKVDKILVNFLGEEKEAGVISASEALQKNNKKVVNFSVQEKAAIPSEQASSIAKTVKPKMASIPKTIDPSKVTVAEALKYLSLPRVVGIDPATGKDITASIGRFGPYVVRDGDFRSIKPPENAYDITLEKAIELLAQEKKPRGFTRKKKTI